MHILRAEAEARSFISRWYLNKGRHCESIHAKPGVFPRLPQTLRPFGSAKLNQSGECAVVFKEAARLRAPRPPSQAAHFSGSTSASLRPASPHFDLVTRIHMIESGSDRCISALNVS